MGLSLTNIRSDKRRLLFSFGLAVFMSAISATVAQAQVHPDEKDDAPIGIFQCGAHPTFEFIDDADGTFIYRKKSTAWQQGHENTYQRIKSKAAAKLDITTSLNGDTCTLTMNFERIKKVFRYKICSQKNSAAGGCGRITEATDISPTRGPSATNKCAVMMSSSLKKGPKFEDALAKCQPPTPVTKKNKRAMPAACKDTSTGVKIEPYTCSYARMPNGQSSQSIVSVAEVGAKYCTDRKITSLCTAKVRCTWNDKIKWNGHVKVYDTYVYCPASAGKCNIDAMTCSTSAEIYFEGISGAKFEEKLRKKYDIPDWKSSAQ